MQRPHRRIVHAAQHHDADVAVFGAESLVQFVRLDELDRRRPAPLVLVLLLHVGGGRQHDAIDVAHRVFQRLAQRVLRLLVVLGDERPMDVAGADANLEHHRRVRRLGKLEPFLDHAHQGRQVRTRVQQPDLRFHRESVRALLHDRGALAVILADHDQRAAGHAAGRQVGEGVGRDIGSGGGLPGHRAADRIHHGGRQRRGGGGLGRRGLEMDAEVVHHVLGVGQDIHQMRNRRALIAADIGDPGLQQRLGDRENSLAAKNLAVAELQILDLACKRAFGHLLRPFAPPARRSSSIPVHQHIFMLEILSMQFPCQLGRGIDAPGKRGYSDEARGLDRFLALRTLYETACIIPLVRRSGTGSAR